MLEAEGRPEEVYKIDRVDGQNLSPSVEMSKTRGHSLKEMCGASW